MYMSAFPHVLRARSRLASLYVLELCEMMFAAVESLACAGLRLSALVMHLRGAPARLMGGLAVMHSKATTSPDVIQN